MGADMILYTLWTDGNPVTPDPAVQAVRAALAAETDQDRLAAAARFVGADLDDLAAAVVAGDPAALASWRVKIGDGYAARIADLISSLDRRDVTSISVGPLIGYATGAPSWGDSPTDTYDVWSQFFDQDSYDPEDVPRNPYADEVYRALFLSPHPRYAKAGDRVVAEVVLATLTEPAEADAVLTVAC